MYSLPLAFTRDTLLYGLPASQLNKVQRVLNTAAKLVCCSPRFSHITPLMYELHWLSLKQHIHFKILLFAFKAVHGIAPTYIQNLLIVNRFVAFFMLLLLMQCAFDRFYEYLRNISN